MKQFTVGLAGAEHLHFTADIEAAILEASKSRGTGLAKRSQEYLRKKILEGKAIIALTEANEFAGFCYIESWGHNRFVANSGLIVLPEYRGSGLAKRIKEKAWHLSVEKFPGAKLFGLTTNLAVMKINSQLGYTPVTYSELTDDEAFWKGCETCAYYDILTRTNRRHCLCTAMICDPRKVSGKKQKKHKISGTL